MATQNSWNAQYNNAKGSLLVGNATRPIVETVGANGTALVADSTQTTGVKWGFPSGTIVNPTQPAFFARLTVTTGGVTGNGGIYTLGNNGGGTLTVITDQGANTSFPGGNFTFTAPATGFYKLGWQLATGTYGAAMTSCGSSIFVNGVTPYNGMTQNPFNNQSTGSPPLIMAQDIALTLTSGDAITFLFSSSGGPGNTVTVRNTSNATYVYGWLVC